MSLIGRFRDRFLAPAIATVENELRARDAVIHSEFQSLRDSQRFSTGLLLEQGHRANPPATAFDARYSVYSQFGEDGIIQYLLQCIESVPDAFVEIGVEDYRQSNTRYLLEKDNWRGLTIDASSAASEFLESSHLRGWRTIEHEAAFVDLSNINEIIGRHYRGEIGLLSIDIDGVDYYIWDAIEVVNPVMVVIEYQPNFGPDAKIAVPYSPAFDRAQHHFSHLCCGASLAALTDLGARKGYDLVETSDGPNAFFVRQDRRGALPKRTAAKAYRFGRYRDSRAANGSHTYITELADRQRTMADALVFDFESGETKTVGQAVGL